MHVMRCGVLPTREWLHHGKLLELRDGILLCGSVTLVHELFSWEIPTYFRGFKLHLVSVWHLRFLHRCVVFVELRRLCDWNLRPSKLLGMHELLRGFLHWQRRVALMHGVCRGHLRNNAGRNSVDELFKLRHRNLLSCRLNLVHDLFGRDVPTQHRVVVVYLLLRGHVLVDCRVGLGRVLQLRHGQVRRRGVVWVHKLLGGNLPGEHRIFELHLLRCRNVPPCIWYNGFWQLRRLLGRNLHRCRGIVMHELRRRNLPAKLKRDCMFELRRGDLPIHHRLIVVGHLLELRCGDLLGFLCERVLSLFTRHSADEHRSIELLDLRGRLVLWSGLRRLLHLLGGHLRGGLGHLGLLELRRGHLHG